LIEHTARHAEVDFYSVLGVLDTATSAEIESAYQKELASERLRVQSSGTGATVVKIAYEALCDPVSRLRYDAARAQLRGVPSNTDRTAAMLKDAPPSRNSIIESPMPAPAGTAPLVASARNPLWRLAFWAMAVLMAGLFAGGASYKLLKSGRPQQTTNVQAVASSMPSPQATRAGASSARSGLPSLGPPGGSGFLPLPSLPDAGTIETPASPATPLANSTQAAATEVGTLTSSQNQTRSGISAPQPSIVTDLPPPPVAEAGSPDAQSSSEVSPPATPTSQPILPASGIQPPQPVLHAPVVLSAPQVLPTVAASAPSSALPGAASGSPPAAPNHISITPVPQSAGTLTSPYQAPTQASTPESVNLPQTCPIGGGISQVCPVVSGQR
jgi:hypothetical protein